MSWFIWLASLRLYNSFSDSAMFKFFARLHKLFEIFSNYLIALVRSLDCGKTWLTSNKLTPKLLALQVIGKSCCCCCPPTLLEALEAILTYFLDPLL